MGAARRGGSCGWSTTRALSHHRADLVEHPPLWCDKGLYGPVLIVRAALLAAR
ncbi:hypothetical protein [Micromonospora sp. NPDC051296]|uniref:hypothetical protein n=1 Tax=Micromonospora sp. NPDC051296 TaxID=3155046 RepID=UPI003419D9EA